MIPGSPQILICPHCGGEKQVMSLLSGNTFGAELWSDNKRIAPMLPEVSYVQKCPHCGKYYIRTKQNPVFANEGHSFELGTLSFEEVKEAFAQFSKEGFEDNEEETNVRMMLFHAYNDFYYRNEENTDVIEADHALFVEQGQWLIDNLISDDTMKAEFYREIGDMQKASEILDAAVVNDDFVRNIWEKVKEKVAANDAKVFKIQ